MLSIVPNIPEILVESQMEGSVSVRSDRNIRGVVYFNRSNQSERNLPFHFDKSIRCRTSCQ